MDADRFDRLAQRVGASRSRRRVLGSLAGGLLAGLSVRENLRESGTVEAATGCGVDRVVIWVKAFIPRVVVAKDGSRHTQMIWRGPHQGKTALPGPPNSQCYLTDQRSFSDHIGAAARIHSAVFLDLTAEGGRIRDQIHRCSKTHEVHCRTGKVLCEKTGTIKGRGFHSFKASGDGQVYTFALDVAASNPCFRVVSPDIDANLRFRVVLNANRTRATISCEGIVDDFPAFEAYAALEDGSPPKQLFVHAPAKGNTPTDLFEWWVLEDRTDQVVSEAVTLTKKCASGLICCGGECVDSRKKVTPCGKLCCRGCETCKSTLTSRRCVPKTCEPCERCRDGECVAIECSGPCQVCNPDTNGCESLCRPGETCVGNWVCDCDCRGQQACKATAHDKHVACILACQGTPNPNTCADNCDIVLHQDACDCDLAAPECCGRIC
jgi:hypothetical protein